MLLYSLLVSAYYIFPIKRQRAELEEAKKELFGHLPPLIKNFYEEHPAVTAMTSEEVSKCRL